MKDSEKVKGRRAVGLVIIKQVRVLGVCLIITS